MKKFRKVVTLILAFVLVTVSMVGCKSNKSDTTSKDQNDGKSSGKKVKIEILQYKVEINDQLQDAIDLYMKQNPNVKITLETVGGGEDIGVTYKTRAAAGNMPDIFNCIGPDETTRYKAFLEDLSDQPWVSHANKGMLDLDTIDGKVYGLPVTTEAFGLIANKKIFDDAGIDISNITTYEQEDQAFAALQAKIDDGTLKDKWPLLKNVVAVQGAEKWVLGDHAVNVALAPEFKEDPNAAFNAKEIQFSYADAYKDYIDLQLKYSANAKDHAGAVSVGYNDAVQGQLALGSVAVIQQGNWIYNDVNTIDPNIAQNLVFLPAPVKGYKEDSIFTLVANYWCVNTQSDDETKKAAKDFLNWLYQSDEGKDIVVNKFGFLPVFDNYGDLAPSDPLSKGILDYASKGKIISAVFKGAPGADWLQQVFGAKVQGYLTGDLTWDQVFEQSAAEWKNMRSK